MTEMERPVGVWTLAFDGVAAARAAVAKRADKRKRRDNTLIYPARGKQPLLKSPWATIRDPWFKAMEQFVPDAYISAVP
jgi:hypothetical protein